MKRAFAVIRVSAEDQLRGYGPDVQWFDDVLPNAPLLGLEVDESLRAIIQESATGWDREQFQEAVRGALRLYKEGKVEALLFPRVDRETRFLFGSFPLLAEVIRAGMEVYFARERLRLDPGDPESVERYLAKATQAQAYVETMRVNTMRAKRRRATQGHKMPTGGRKWAFDYDPATGQYRKNEARAVWIARCYRWVLEEGLSLYACCRRLEVEGVPPPGYELWARSVEKGRAWNRRRPPSAGTWFPGTLRGLLLDEGNVGRF
ncbi:MAG: recombinase family protein, partial [Chloroflexota bacterium]|nr:recombinase family protein [Chloroflexota bacterium]